jgi:hypothetical protein
MRRPFLSIAIVILFAVSCTPTAFSPHLQDNNLNELKNALNTIHPREMARPENQLGKPLLFVVTAKPTRIIAYDLSAKAPLWEMPADVTSKISVGRDKIFFRSGASTLEGRDLATGRSLWSTPLLGANRLLGITTDGEDVYYANENTKRDSDGTTAYLVGVSGANGAKKWIQSSQGRLGAPVARDGRVFLPLRYQSVAIIETQTGTELARIRSKEEALIWVRSTDQGIQFGSQKGVYQLDGRSTSGTQKDSTFFSPQLPSLIRTAFWWDGYNAALSGYTAFDRNRILWDLSPDGRGFANHTVIVHNYRFLFAFDTAAKTDAQHSGLKWAFSMPRQDIIASALTGHSLVLVAGNGEILFLDPSNGQIIGTPQSIKAAVQGVTFDTAGFAAPNSSTAGHDLRQTLTEIIWDPDRRFGMVKLFCVEQLAQLQGGRVTEDLVKIISHEKVDPAVYKSAGEMIVSRHEASAIPLYLAELKSHYNFLEGTQSPPVDILARALGEFKSPEAVKPLLLHLADHETPLPAVENIIRALVAIGDRTVLEPFRDYLLTYRCDPIMDKAPGVLTALAEGLLKLGGENERRMLSFVENDSSTRPFLRTYLQQAIKQTKPAAGPKKNSADAAAQLPVNASAP